MLVVDVVLNWDFAASTECGGSQFNSGQVTSIKILKLIPEEKFEFSLVMANIGGRCCCSELIISCDFSG